MIDFAWFKNTNSLFNFLRKFIKTKIKYNKILF